MKEDKNFQITLNLTDIFNGSEIKGTEIKVSEIKEDVKILNLIEKKLIEKKDSSKHKSQVDYVTDLKHLLNKFFILPIIEMVKYDFDEIILCVKDMKERFLKDITDIENGEMTLYK